MTENKHPQKHHKSIKNTKKEPNNPIASMHMLHFSQQEKLSTFWASIKPKERQTILTMDLKTVLFRIKLFDLHTYLCKCCGEVSHYSDTDLEKHVVNFVKNVTRKSSNDHLDVSECFATNIMYVKHQIMMDQEWIEAHIRTLLKILCFIEGNTVLKPPVTRESCEPEKEICTLGLRKSQFYSILAFLMIEKIEFAYREQCARDAQKNLIENLTEPKSRSKKCTKDKKMDKKGLSVETTKSVADEEWSETKSPEIIPVQHEICLDFFNDELNTFVDPPFVPSREYRPVPFRTKSADFDCLGRGLNISGLFI